MASACVFSPPEDLNKLLGRQDGSAPISDSFLHRKTPKLFGVYVVLQFKFKAQDFVNFVK